MKCFCLVKPLIKKNEYSRIFTCPVGVLPSKYLGLPVDEKRIRNKHWKPHDEKTEKKCGTWLGRLMANAGRITLIKSSLAGIPYFMMSFYGLPVGVNKRMVFFRARLLWQENLEKKKYHLVRWSKVCKPKDMGGLGIQNLALMNKALLRKWGGKYITQKSFGRACF